MKEERVPLRRLTPEERQSAKEMEFLWKARSRAFATMKHPLHMSRYGDFSLSLVRNQRIRNAWELRLISVDEDQVQALIFAEPFSGWWLVKEGDSWRVNSRNGVGIKSEFAALDIYDFFEECRPWVYENKDDAVAGFLKRHGFVAPYLAQPHYVTRANKANDAAPKLFAELFQGTFNSAVCEGCEECENGARGFHRVWVES